MKQTRWRSFFRLKRLKMV